MGVSLLLECAGKQHLVSAEHMFSEVVSDRDAADLARLAEALRNLSDGRFDGLALRQVMLHGGRIPAADMLMVAAPTDDPRLAGIALALALTPFGTVDAFASLLIAGGDLRGVARGIDPAGDLEPRTRLFVADHLIRRRNLPVLIAAVAGVTALKANGRRPDFAELADPSSAERRRRLGAVAAVYAASPDLLSLGLHHLRACDWRSAERLGRRVSLMAAGSCGMEAAEPPAIADLMLLSVLPTCDTIDAAARMMAPRSARHEPMVV
ncbi:hypothetical protein [Mangrovicella endophytica]|uniref:hypothetical protein n=1 Tax=Mangrovicella endophytica TaxID=2066697 RepID=UPI000C9E0F82|nr:hypothetical protein [Mangrovicella endophytica]